ncbi:streptophobe family protein [Streptomyces sp. NPDC006879]|uniref:streptophobe family protein n=1 Tax=Streptomyces sp. NPDC006879 TaxID=3364767 RepID=UPI0036858F0D
MAANAEGRTPETTGGGSWTGWRDALVAVVSAFLAMFALAAAGLAAAGAGQLPSGSFPSVLAAVVVMAVGGCVEVSGNAGFLADADAQISFLPLSVTLCGALVLAYCFLRPLRHHATAPAGMLLIRAGQLALLWLLALGGIAAAARHSFAIDTGDSPVGQLGEIFGLSPTVGFRTAVLPTLFFGLLWLLGVLLVALLVSRGAPLPPRLVRFQQSVRPAAFGMVFLLLSYVVVGLVVGLVVAATQGHGVETLAVILLGLPNLAWPALTLGLGGAWQGRVDGPFGLPMPPALDDVLRTSELSQLDVATLADHDGRAVWLIAVAVVLLLAAAFLTAVRSPASMRPWQHALHVAVALVLTVLMICLTGRIHAQFGLSLLGIGDVGGLGGVVDLQAQLWRNLGVALLCGAVAGFLGAVAATRVRRRGESTRSRPN